MKLYKNLNFNLIFGISLVFILQNAFAGEHLSLGSIAETLTTGAGVMTHIMHFVCIVTGVIFIIMAFSLYQAHRTNPKYVPLDRPILYLVFAIVLIALPFFGEIFTETGSAEYIKKKESQKIQLEDIDAPINWGNDYDH